MTSSSSYESKMKCQDKRQCYGVAVSLLRLKFELNYCYELLMIDTKLSGRKRERLQS